MSLLNHPSTHTSHFVITVILHLRCLLFFFPPTALCLKKLTCSLNPPRKTMLSLLLPTMLAVQAMGGCRPCLCPGIRAESPQWEMLLSFKKYIPRGLLVFPLQQLHWAKQPSKRAYSQKVMCQ